MELFARCFLLVFAELYVGGLLALSVPPFHEIERGFYKSSAAVYLGIGCVAVLGRLMLLTSAAAAPAQAVELAFWITSLLAAGVYLYSLWGESFRLRARVYAAAWLTGVIALIISAQAFRLSPLLSFETLLYPLNFLIAALLLGAVTTSMLLGHWYLIDRSLSIEPFRSMFRFFAVMLVLQTAVVLFGGGLLGVLGARVSAAELGHLLHDHQGAMLARLLLSPVATAGLAWMIWKTLQIPQTMAATGLFYIAILSVLVGEFMSRFILFRTSLPL